MNIRLNEPAYFSVNRRKKLRKTHGKREEKRRTRQRLTFCSVKGLLCEHLIVTYTYTIVKSASSNCLKSTDLDCLRVLNGYFNISFS